MPSQFYWSEILGMTTQSDGKLVIVGTAQLDNSLSLPFDLAEFELHWLIARYTSTGQIDTDFGTFGYTLITWDSQGSSESPGHEATDVKVLSNGKILVSGVVSYRVPSTSPEFQLGIVRLTSSGILDSTFGTSGRTTVDPGGAGYWSRVKLSEQSTGRIIIATTNWQSDGDLNRFEMYGLTSAGIIDTTFGTLGKVASQYVSLKRSDCWSLLIDSNDKIILGGTGRDSGDNDGWFINRWLSNGSADTGFGGAGADGNAHYQSWAYSGGYIFDLRLRSDGKIFAIGNSPRDGSGHEQTTVMQYTTSGAPDTGWGGGDGIVHVDLSGSLDANTSASAACVLSDDSLVIFGSTVGDGSGGFSDGARGLIIRIDSDGVYQSYSLFDTGTSSEVFYNAHLGTDGKLYAGGHIMNDTAGPRKARYMCARYGTAGTLDTSFGDTGNADLGTSPSVTTDAVSSISTTTATANATVNPQGVATSVKWAYGVTEDALSLTAAVSAGSGSSPVPVSTGLTGLHPSTDYIIRAVADNGRFTRGTRQTFTTALTLLDGLKAYWALEDSTDSTANGYDLTNNGSVTFGGTGIQNNAAEFSGGTTKYLSINNNSDLQIEVGQDWTISMWVWFTSLPGNTGLAHKGTDSSWQMQLWFHSGAGIKFTLYNGSSWIDATWAVTPNTSQWYHLVGQYDSTGNKVILWVDNVLRAQPSLAGTLDTDTNPLRLGRVPSLTNLDGLIDEVGVWKALLNSDQINALYNSGSGVTWPLS